MKISKLTCISSASLPAVRPGALGVGLQKFHTIKVMAAHLRKCWSEDDLPTAPWRFLLSFIPFLVLLYSFSKVRISPKVTIACYGFCLLCHTKTWLARDIISYNPWTNSFCVFRALFASALLTSACKQA